MNLSYLKHVMKKLCKNSCEFENKHFLFFFIFFLIFHFFFHSHLDQLWFGVAGAGHDGQFALPEVEGLGKLLVQLGDVQESGVEV